jgi:GNAT superfamily N-acetyltransferase
MFAQPADTLAPEAPRYSTRELTVDRWPDFEKLFSNPGEWNPCMCTYYHRPSPIPKEQRLKSRAGRARRNLRDHRALLADGCAHGIIVYAGAEPVGWCQYGPKEELPRIDAKRNYRRIDPDSGGSRLWRITCFVVVRKHRKLGVASIALKAALHSIENRGGGLVEGYPITHWGALANWFGTVQMFKNEGFETVAQFGKSAVLMRKTVNASSPDFRRSRWPSGTRVLRGDEFVTPSARKKGK